MIKIVDRIYINFVLHIDKYIDNIYIYIYLNYILIIYLIN